MIWFKNSHILLSPSQVKWLVAVHISIVYFQSIYIECFFFFPKWWNVYSVSIISSDCTLKVPTKGNRTKLFFFFFLNVLHPNYIQSWFSFVLKGVGLLFLCSSLVCFVWAVIQSPPQEAWVMRAPQLTSAWGWVFFFGGRWDNVPLLLIYQQNLLLLLMDWNVCCIKTEGRSWGRAGGGKRSAPNTDNRLHTKIQTNKQKTWRGTNPLTFSIWPGGFLTDQIVWTQRWDDTTRCIFELNAVTVQDCRKKTKKNCKKGFSVFMLNNTPEALHSWVLYKSFGSFFSLCILFTLSCKQLCEKCLQWVLKGEMCIRYAARVLWPIFTFSLSVFTLFMCHSAKLRMPVYEDAEDHDNDDDGGGGGGDRNWTGLRDRRAFIRSQNVVVTCCGGDGDHRLACSVKGVTCCWIKVMTMKCIVVHQEYLEYNWCLFFYCLWF